MLEWDEILLRLSLAAFLGGLVGIERERKDWVAGVRTHMLASMGSALMMIVSSFGFSDILAMPNVSLDPSRVASSVIIGIGYLGAGIILVLKRGNIKGLTTASGLWTTAGIGLATGGGMYFTAAAATLIALVILYGVQLLQKKLSFSPRQNTLLLYVKNRSQANAVIEKLLERKTEFSSIALKRKAKNYCVQTAVVSSRAMASELAKELRQLPEIKALKLKFH